MFGYGWFDVRFVSGNMYRQWALSTTFVIEVGNDQRQLAPKLFLLLTKISGLFSTSDRVNYVSCRIN